jgi:ADP-ribose pyrophosphatase YjhB (NUDIX family)
MATVGVFAAIFDDKDRILLVKITYGSGNWTFPGGHLEKNESPIDGVKREVLEETGYIVDVEHLISVYSAPNKDDLVLLFKCKIIEQVGIYDNEIEQIAFFTRDDLPTQIHPWNIKRINDAYENKISNIYVFK